MPQGPPARTVGVRLREAREKKGVSLRQIANSTRISVMSLEALERSDLSRLPGGIFTRPMEHRLIARGHGERSLLANYGLPPAIADFDHPPVRGRPIQPIFRNREDIRYRMLVDWMNTTLSPFEPDYGILYTPPMPTTQPAPPERPQRPVSPARGAN